LLLLRLELGDPRVAVVILFPALLHSFAGVVCNTADYCGSHQRPPSSEHEYLPFEPVSVDTRLPCPVAGGIARLG
jgi:hypothetical protein